MPLRVSEDGPAVDGRCNVCDIFLWPKVDIYCSEVLALLSSRRPVLGTETLFCSMTPLLFRRILCLGTLEEVESYALLPELWWMFTRGPYGFAC